MAEASTVPLSVTWWRTSEEMLAAVMPVGSGEALELATSQPN